MIQEHTIYESRAVMAFCNIRSDSVHGLSVFDDCGYCIDAPHRIPSGGAVRYNAYLRADGSISRAFFISNIHRPGDL